MAGKGAAEDGKKEGEKKKPYRFPKGHKFSKGGARPGAGRPTEAHRAACRKLIEKYGVREFFGETAGGGRVDYFVTVDGKRLRIPASVNNRLKAGEVLMDHGYGKAPTIVKVNAKFAEQVITAVSNALHAIPDSCPKCKAQTGVAAEIAAALEEVALSITAAEAEES